MKYYKLSSIESYYSLILSMGIHISVEQIIFVSYGYTCIKLDNFTSYIESCHFSNAFYMEIDPSMNKFIRDLHINLDIEGSKC